jgi:hypothetical protein
VGCVLAGAALAGCGVYDSLDVGRTSAEPAKAEPNAVSTWAMPDPGPLQGTLLTADLLVVGDTTLSAALTNRVNDLSGVRLATPLSMASVPVGERSITVAAVDVASYRRYTDEVTAGTDAVWQAVANGDVTLSHQIGRDLNQPLGGTLGLRRHTEELALRIGAYATTVPQIDAVVNERRRAQLGMKQANALLVSVDHVDVDDTARKIRELVGDRADVRPLTETTTREGTRQAAHLAGGSVAQAVGSFSYRYFDDGSVQPEARWVAANIRTENVPILGRVTCHRVMLSQLRAALEDVVRQGLAGSIDPGDYGGCYVPRFIGRDPARGLSLHTWGIAIDLNVAGNQRGTLGEIDRRVVGIFKKWGFAWGGDWQWTDPMHFELATLVRG